MGPEIFLYIPTLKKVCKFSDLKANTQIIFTFTLFLKPICQQ